MGVVNVPDLRVVVFVVLVIAFALIVCRRAYMLGFNAAERANSNESRALDAFYDGYNIGYTRGVEVERERQCKN